MVATASSTVARAAAPGAGLDPRTLDLDALGAGALTLDLSAGAFGDDPALLRAARKALSRCEREGRPVWIRSTLGAEGEARALTVARARALWDLYEEHRPRLLVDFPRLPDGDHDPIAHPPDGPPRIPSSPAPVRPDEPLALWELETLRRLMGVRVGLSTTRKVIINLTYKCNNYCTFCAVGNRLHENGDYRFHLDTLRQYRERGVDLCDFDGGEPTIYPNLLKVIRASREMGYRQVNITTNGRTAAYPHIARKLLGSGLTSLLISCHGPTADVHDAEVQRRGAFRQTLQGIKNVVSLKPDWIDFGVNITLTRTNWPHLAEYYALMDRIGVRKINVQFLTPFGRAEEDIVPDPADIAPLLAEQLDRYDGRIRSYLINVPFCFFPGREQHVVGDVLKLQRNMVFVTQEKVNLFEYLAGSRVRTEQCEGCVFSVACEGFYSFEETFD